MKTRYAGIFVLAIGLLCATATISAPLQAYGQLPDLGDLALSPDGKQLAYLTVVAGQRSIIIYTVDTSKVLAVLGTGNQKLRDIRWADNDELLISTSKATTIGGVISSKEEYWRTQAFSISAMSGRFLLSDNGNSLSVITSLPESRTIGGHTVVFVTGIHFVNNRGALALFSVDLSSGHTTLVEPGSYDSIGWLVDVAGDVIAATEYNRDKKLWSLSVRRSNQWAKAYEVTAPIDTPQVQGIGQDGNSIILRAFEDGHIVEKTLNLADGSWNKSPDADAALGYPITDPSSHRIIGTKTMGARSEYVFSSRNDQEALDSVAHAFFGENVELMSWSADRMRVVVRVDGVRDGSVFELVDLNTGLARVLGPAYLGIHASDVADVRFLSYAASDGRTIPAYLTIPNGRAPKNLALVVLPHGGPLGQDNPGFNWWAQALASRGYAVLQPEFRGSDGFGWKHASAGFGQWGRKMQTDLSDGVRYLAAQGTIDPRRVCIVGASYGGYASLAGPTLDPGIYRCAVAVAGISDPRAFLKWVETREFGSDSISMRFWARFMGISDYDDPKLAEISPLAHIANVAVPILLIHGNDDTVVPIAQSEGMESALESAGKPVTFVRLQSEDHWLSRSDTREQMLEATVAFLETNNPPN